VLAAAARVGFLVLQENDLMKSAKTSLKVYNIIISLPALTLAPPFMCIFGAGA
jgi:hypothetical protein